VWGNSTLKGLRQRAQRMVTRFPASFSRSRRNRAAHAGHLTIIKKPL
jgi:hypothetical protein